MAAGLEWHITHYITPLELRLCRVPQALVIGHMNEMDRELSQVSHYFPRLARTRWWLGEDGMIMAEKRVSADDVWRYVRNSLRKFYGPFIWKHGMIGWRTTEPNNCSWCLTLHVSCGFIWNYRSYPGEYIQFWKHNWRIPLTPTVNFYSHGKVFRFGRLEVSWIRGK